MSNDKSACVDRCLGDPHLSRCPRFRLILCAAAHSIHAGRPRTAKCSRRPVSRILSRTIIPLGAALLRTLVATYPRVWRTGPARALPLTLQRFPPIWSCSVWGLPCLRPYSRSGALLPHLFTLTLTLADGAVCSLWHLPSRSLDAPVPDVIRHTALRSSDFPLPAKPLELAGSDRPAACYTHDTRVRAGCAPEFRQPHAAQPAFRLSR